MVRGWLPILVCAVGMPAVGGVRLQIREGRPVVDGIYLNGHGPYRFLLDTGTNVNLIEKSLALAIGMNVTFYVELESAVGKISVGGSDENEVELGPAKVNGQRFLYSGLESIHKLMPDVRGVLGQSFLSGFDYTLDLRGKRLDFGTRNSRGMRSQARMLNGRTAVSTSLGNLVLDSGADRLVLFGVGPDRRDKRYMRTSAGSEIVGVVYSRLIIEGRDIWQGDAVALPDRAEPGVAGLMPLRLFRTIYVCNSEGYVVFE
jgi:hypothetical protein